MVAAMPLHIVHHPDYDADLPADHRFPMGKYLALMAALRARRLIVPETLHQPATLPAAQLALAHDPHYVAQVISCTVPPVIEREIGFAIVDRISRRAQLATAGTLLAARLALEHGIACNTAGGSHHARRAQGAGFCTLNDVGVAGSVLLADRAVSQILVVDLDVHQGDGTADIFRDEPDVFTFSMHAERNFPVRKISSSLDIGLADKTGDADYLERLQAVLPELERSARPDIVFYNAGVDPHGSDRLGRLALSSDGLRARDATVIGYFRERGIPVCGVIGGGYSTDLAELAARHAILFETAAGLA
jgi:acetoin utilization deacetylase AcuC-like enzyme